LQPLVGDAISRAQAARPYRDAIVGAQFLFGSSIHPQDRCLLIDATEPKSAVAEHIWKSVSERLAPVRTPPLHAGTAS
jgi:hypothetical protein